MRLIHTSDWHLGQTFKGFDRSAEHQVFLDWLLDTLQERGTDALLVAGDIFDQANPSAAAQQQFFRFLAEARRRCPALDIVVIAGNHDSPGRIEAPHPVLDAFGVKVAGLFPGRGALDDAALDRLAVPLTNAEGAVAAWVLAMPFLRPGDLARADDGRYPSAVREAYAQLAAACAARRAPDQALVVMGHLHVQGAAVSEDSERRLVIGGEEALDAGIFPPEAAYVALGHLHRPQGLGGGHIRYCGSPLPLSFSEMDYPHQVVEVELDGAALAATRPLHTPRPVPLLRVPATHQPLEQVLEALDALQLEPAAEGLEPLLEVQVLASIAPTGMRARVEAALTGKPVRLTGIQRRRPERAPDAAAGATGATPRFDLSALRPEPLFERLLDDHPDLDNREGLRDALAELLDRVAQEA